MVGFCSQVRVQFSTLGSVGTDGKREGTNGDMEGTDGDRDGTDGDREGTDGDREGAYGDRENLDFMIFHNKYQHISFL